MTDPGRLVARTLHLLRRHLVAVAVAASVAAVAALAAVITVLLTGGQTAHSPVGTAAAGAQHAGSATQGSTWLAGPGGRRLTLVIADLSEVSAAGAAGRESAERTAGARLAADAAAALTGTMPPADAAGYRSALGQLRAAGSEAAAGRFGPGTARLLLAGRMGLMKVTAAADMPVDARAPARPAGPAG